MLNCSELHIFLSLEAVLVVFQFPIDFSKLRGYCMSKLFSKPRGCGVLKFSELFF